MKNSCKSVTKGKMHNETKTDSSGS